MNKSLEEQGRSEHFKLIRESASYRNFLILEELQAETMPALSPAPQQMLNKTIDQTSISTPWSAKQWDTVKQMQAMILHLQEKVGELQETKKRKGDKYIIK